jgi:hypothetical protein
MVGKTLLLPHFYYPRGNTMRMRTYPGRLTREQWLKLSVAQRRLHAARAESDLLGLWRACRKKPCRRAHACHGDERCKLRPYEADFKNPNFGQPDFAFSFRFPRHLRIPSAILDHLPFERAPPTPEHILQDCAAEAGAEAALALHLVFRLARRRTSRTTPHQ